MCVKRLQSSHRKLVTFSTMYGSLRIVQAQMLLCSAPSWFCWKVSAVPGEDLKRHLAPPLEPQVYVQSLAVYYSALPKTLNGDSLPLVEFVDVPPQRILCPSSRAQPFFCKQVPKTHRNKTRDNVGTFCLPWVRKAKLRHSIYIIFSQLVSPIRRSNVRSPLDWKSGPTV